MHSSNNKLQDQISMEQILYFILDIEVLGFKLIHCLKTITFIINI